MEKAIELANDLVKEILNSACYRDYFKACEKIRESPELLTKIQDFKEYHLDFHAKKLREGFVSFEEEKYVSKLYSDLLLNEDTGNFMEKERSYLKFVEEILSVLSKITADL